MTRQEFINEVLLLLEQAYPDAGPELEFSNPFELLIATILSAQCTDRQVNKCTKLLFEDYPSPESIACMTMDELSAYIRSCGFYNTKAKNILKTCKILVERYDGKVPSEREKLEALPGVGRKTASVVLSNAFDIPAIAVDTHVFRVSNRIGIVKAKNVEQTEIQLMKYIPEKKWSIAHHYLIFHGRRVCYARNPDCMRCFLNGLCKEYEIRNGE